MLQGGESQKQRGPYGGFWELEMFRFFDLDVKCTSFYQSAKLCICDIFLNLKNKINSIKKECMENG